MTIDFDSVILGWVLATVMFSVFLSVFGEMRD